jgi:hypothetical protein
MRHIRSMAIPAVTIDNYFGAAENKPFGIKFQNQL